MEKSNCCICEKEISGSYVATFVDKKFISGHKSCIYPLTGTSDPAMRFSWGDGQPGSYGVGWLNDVKHRKVVNGEVVRDYGRRYFT